MASWKSLTTSRITTPPTSAISFGGNVAISVIGGSLVPVAVNVQLGGAYTDSASGRPPETTVTGAVGISVPVRAAGINIEPYASPGFRRRKGGVNDGMVFGYVIGANVGFGALGVHLAYDYEHWNFGGSLGVVGLGLHAAIKLPRGM